MMRTYADYSQSDLFTVEPVEAKTTSLRQLKAELSAFSSFGTKTRIDEFQGGDKIIPVFINEFWTSKQRAANSLHEISYRACFKPQLPRFFIERLTKPGGTVYDPFLGRGTTVIEAGLLGRRGLGCDVNPLSSILTSPRLRPPRTDEVRRRLAELDWSYSGEVNEDLLTFYHPETLREIYALRAHLLALTAKSEVLGMDAWIRMVATNRLTGHSPGFFSVYTLPPNQAVTAARQQRINKLRDQTPPRRSVPELILRKTQTLLKDVTEADRLTLRRADSGAVVVTGSSDETPELQDGRVDLVVTSPPFLDVVDYAGDNWLRCWFNGIDPSGIGIWTDKKPGVWSARMTRVFLELSRILKPGGYIAFEVGEVRGGKVKMEDLVIPAAQEANLDAALVLINSQVFTKTANCWGVSNNQLGTNTNRVVMFQKSVGPGLS